MFIRLFLLLFKHCWSITSNFHNDLQTFPSKGNWRLHRIIFHLTAESNRQREILESCYTVFSHTKTHSRRKERSSKKLLSALKFPKQNLYCKTTHPSIGSSAAQVLPLLHFCWVTLTTVSLSLFSLLRVERKQFLASQWCCQIHGCKVTNRP